MFTTRPEIRGTHGMVASTHYLATMAGWRMFERGGNAFDAAVATGLALQIVHPYQNGPGGDLPIVLHDARAGPVAEPRHRPARVSSPSETGVVQGAHPTEV